MRVVMLGTGPFAVPTLERVAATHDVAGVVTRPPRGRRPSAPPMQLAAQRLGLPLWQPDTLNSDDARDQLRAWGPELLVVCDYGEILQAATLAVAPRGGVNLHASLLPRYRGAAPVQWALLHGDAETGNTVIEMTPGLDAGPCLGVQRTPIDPEEDAEQLEARLAQSGAELVLEVLARLERGDCPRTPQDPAQKSRAPRLDKAQSEIDWSLPALRIHNQVRALRPWPRAATCRHRASSEPLRLIIERTAAPAADDAPSPPAEVAALGPGSVWAVDERLWVQAGDRPLEVLVLQPTGKRAMTAAEYLRGSRVVPGERWGP